MGAFLDKPKTDKVNDRGSGNGLHFGLSSMQGWRVEMEDAHCANLSVPGLKDWSFFAVFDGHAGAKVSAHCAEHLQGSILANDKFKGTNASTSPTINNVIQGIRQGFLDLDEKMRKLPDMDSGEDKSGSTAVCCMLSPSSIIFGNCGDSRGVLVRDGKVFFSTQDHKPINPVEKERIQNAGGSVMIQRVNGSLAVSRALGDFEYKNVVDKSPIEQLVSPEPEMEAIDRTPQDEFIVLACDGIWDVMTNDELASFIRSRMLLTDNLALICNDVVDTCLYKGSRDNMSIIIVSLEGVPKVSAEAIKKEDELNTRLENRVKEIADTEEADLPYVMHILSSEQIDGLPPGGGLPAKRAVVESYFRKLHPENADHRDDD